MLRILQKHSLGLTFFACAALVGAQGPQSAAPGGQRRNNSIPPAPDQAAVDRGQAEFVKNCRFCHGKDANGGDSGPDLIRSVLVNHDENGNLIAPVVQNGRPDKGMPKFDLTMVQISDIASFLHARNRLVRYRQLYETKQITSNGNPTTGQAYFAAYCASCHSPSGDLAHVASKYDPEALAGMFLYPGRGPKQPSSTVEVVLRSGQKFSGRLQEIDEFTVSMYDANGDYHTWPRDGVSVTVHDPLEEHQQLLSRYTDDDIHNILAYLETLK